MLECNTMPFYEHPSTIGLFPSCNPQAICNIIKQTILNSHTIATFVQESTDLAMYQVDDPSQDDNLEQNLLLCIADSVRLLPCILSLPDKNPSFNIYWNFPVIGDEDQTT